MNIDFNNQSSIRKLEFFIKQKLDVFVKRPKKINKVNVSKDDNLTAKTNGKEITLGTRYLPKTENEKMVFFLGLATHEMSHILYTNFSIMKNIFYSEQDFFHYIKNQQLLFNSPILDDSSSSQYISNGSRKIQSTNTSKILQQAINQLQHNSDSTQSSTQQGEQNSCNSNDGYFDEKEQEVDLSDLLSVRWLSLCI